MRQIKFRGKSIYTPHDWKYGSLLVMGGKKYIIPCTDRMQLLQHRVIPNTVCEFSGSTDKNGVEIYEGDILKTNEADWVGKVEFKHSAYIISDDNGGYSTYPDFSKCEVIGNFFENPELLNNKQNAK